MATLHSAIPIISHQYTSSSSSRLSFIHLSSTINLRISFSSPLLSLHLTSAVCPHSLFLNNPPFNRGARLCSALQELSLDQNHDVSENNKLFIFNFPWSYLDADIKQLFGQCGTVAAVEIVKQKNGRSRGFAFVTMASQDEAQAAIHKFNSQEISGRVILVEFAKRLKKSPPPPPRASPEETVNKLYVSNLAWQVRSNNLREFFSENFNPTAGRVVFDSLSGRSAGYGFVSFATREEAQTALSSLQGKELMGRPIRLKFSEKNENESETTKQDIVENQCEEPTSDSEPRF